jgi:hypothetical protein
MLVAWFAVFGIVSAFGPLAIAHGKALFAPHQVGRGRRSSIWGPWAEPF